MTDVPWSHVLRLSAVGRTTGPIALEADEAARRRIAKLLDLAELKSLTASVQVEPWFDGAQIDADWHADLVQTCGVTLEPLPSALSEHFRVRVVPEDSAQAPSPESEVSLDPDADDPPDVLEDEAIDLAAYVVEHLALAIDPFPRKPGVEFEPPKDDADLSPFAALRVLKDRPQT
jgi:uncharacterized metal-binding protein YceD (DUF177 family)